MYAHHHALSDIAATMAANATLYYVCWSSIWHLLVVSYNGSSMDIIPILPEAEEMRVPNLCLFALMSDKVKSQAAQQ